MRVQLRDDRGVVAVMTALLIVPLVGITAFSTDFGLAYVSKRQLQASADAAALAAAQELGKYRGGCSAVVTNSAAVTAAKKVAEDFAEVNRAGQTPTEWNVACSADNRSIEVTYGNSGTTPRLFGGVYGSGDYLAARTATAAVGVPSGGFGLRPYYTCITDAEALQATSGTGFLQLAFPNPTCGNQPGNWYTADCPEDGQGNGTPVIAYNTKVGCESLITIVDTSSATSDSEIRDLLLAACRDVPILDEDCLTGNTGNLPSNPIEAEWDDLLGQEIALPVFRADTVTGTGNNATYPVKAILGVKVCAYKWNSKYGASTDSDCSGITRPGGNDNFLWLKFVNLQVSGSSSPYICDLGDATCDFGARSVRLVK